ncbi:MAG: Rap1a/Tai family immunity protein [Steroidobacteraceae bacterium]
MKSLATALTVTGVLLTAAASAAQQAMTAGDLQQLCVGSDHVSQNACRIYILGVTQGIAVGMHIADGKSRAGRPCVPAGISAEALELMLKRKLAGLASPADRDGDASGFIAAALICAYPCTKEGH